MKIKLLLTLFICCFVYYFGSTQDTDRHISEANLIKEVTVLTSSFDGYSELWGPHYKLLFKNWPALKGERSFIPVMLISNKLSYDDPRVISLKIGDDTTWSKNLRNALKSVKTKYTFLLFDDYIINSPVNEPRLLELLALLERTNGAYVEAIQDDGQFIYGHEKEKKFAPGIEGVVYRSKGSACRNSLQASLWNTEELRKLIKPEESAWDFEIVGNARTQDNPKPFYMVASNSAVTYLNAVAKRVYEKDVVEYINSQGIDFHPTAFPIMTRPEIYEYLNTKKAQELLSPSKSSAEHVELTIKEDGFFKWLKWKFSSQKAQ